ncbi:hypothetical protein D3C76_1222570 [compost metagenome]
MPSRASSRTRSASSGLSTSTPTSVFHSTERGSKLNEPMKVFLRSKTIALLCRLESELPRKLILRLALGSPGWRRSSYRCTPCSSSALR